MSVVGMRRGRFLQAVLAVLLVLGSVSFALPAMAQAQDDLPEPAEDLAAMTLNPLDLQGAGIDGFAIRTGKFVEPATLASMLAAWTALEPAGFADALTGNGATEAYTLEMVDAVVPGDAAQGTEGYVSSSVITFADESDATAALDDLTAGGIFPGATDASGDVADGYAASVDVVPSDGSPTLPGALSVRQTGRHIGIAILAPTDAVTEIEPLADRLIEKIDILVTDPGPDLGRRTLRFTGNAAETQLGEYFVGYSIPLRLVSQSDAAYEFVGVRYAGVVHGFQQIQIVTTAEGAKYGVQTVVVTFESEEEASAWFSDALARQEQLRGQSDLQLDESFPTVGDESTSLTYKIENGNSVRQATVRLGTSVAVIDIIGRQLIGPEPLQEVATLQAGCFDAICEPQEPPVSLIGEVVATPEAPVETPAETPVTESTPEVIVPDATPEPGTSEATPVTVATVAPTDPASGESIASEDLYGLQVTYDPAEWQFVGQTVDGTRSAIEMTNGISTVQLVGDSAYAGDPKSCFDDALASLETDLGATQVTEVRDANDNPTYVQTEKSVQGIYSYVNVDGETDAVSIYCTIIKPGETTLLTIGTAPMLDFPGQLPLIADLIQTVRARQ